MKSITILLLIYSFYVTAQTGVLFQKTYGGADMDTPYAIGVFQNGDMVFGGISLSNISGEKSEDSRGADDFWVIKTDANGQEIWQRTIGGTVNDRLFCLTANDDGTTVVGGASNSNISGEKTEPNRGSADYWILKLDINGSILWQKTIGGDQPDFLTSINKTADGGYILGGSSSSNISGEKTEGARQFTMDYWIVKLDGMGNIQWQKTIGGNAADWLYTVVQTSDLGYIVGGYSQSNASFEKTEDARGLSDYWVLKLDQVGNIIWQRTLGGTGQDILYSVFENYLGQYVLSGASSSDISGEKTENSRGLQDYWIVTLNPEGSIVWQKTIGGSEGEEPYASIEMTNHNIAVTGTSRSGISGEKTEESRGSSDGWLVVLSETGQLLGQKTLGGELADDIQAISETPDGNLMLACLSLSGISGDKTDYNRGGSDYWLVKTNTQFLGVSEKTIYDFSLYPNPASQTVHIASSDKISKVTVKDILGNEKPVIMQCAIDSVDVDISGFSSGIYFVTLSTASDKAVTRKLIVK